MSPSCDLAKSQRAQTSSTQIRGPKTGSNRSHSCFENVQQNQRPSGISHQVTKNHKNHIFHTFVILTVGVFLQKVIKICVFYNFLYFFVFLLIETAVTHPRTTFLTIMKLKSRLHIWRFECEFS